MIMMISIDHEMINMNETVCMYVLFVIIWDGEIPQISNVMEKFHITDVTWDGEIPQVLGWRNPPTRRSLGMEKFPKQKKSWDGEIPQAEVYMLYLCMYDVCMYVCMNVLMYWY